MVWFGNDNEIFAGAVPTPAGRDGEPVFIVELMTEFARVENRGGRCGVHTRADT